LRDGIHELRARKGRVNYRLLYFFNGPGTAVLVHCLTKTDVVPASDINRALRRKRWFLADPEAHTYTE
jgi:phage-related protein